MDRVKALRIVNPVMALLALNQGVTALLHDHLSDDVFSIVHEGGGAALLLCAAAHVGLNWSWVKATVRQMTGPGA
ncbi:MAG: hypothetical protein ABIJ56_21410 [Pseudomonadota bacterium]